MDNVPSLADIAAVTDKNDGLGGSMGGGFWIFALIILFAMMGNGFGGWGNRGIQSQMAECCCAVQRGMDAINANIDAKFAALEKAQLEQRIAQLEQANNQLFVREQLTGVVRYPNGYTYNAGNSPFCGNGCGSPCCC